ncbi:ABC transporter ATP-binding protein [Rathayibacter sp. VKM Ac-2857]|uniref:ABC transporter ATP-binding protein n=1 Tax=Rathayibacter sp. VKM Ac-2857 TaxID=2739020 RepID=UPI0015634042|nr:ABC transporter ATP-binding protein [Rathayibacter sp. VKM Ac-2857]NQX18033.1 ABC transporter ATP-binding protein [Rathayibacter sp. VKM Ac-2857]
MITAESIDFSYRRGPRVLSDFSAVVMPSEMVAITGPSGRGKSTLLYVLGLMATPESGRIRIDGIDVSGLSDRSRAEYRAENIGFVFQDAALDPTRTVLDNIVETSLYQGRRNKAVELTAHGLMERFGVALRASARPHQVSGGQAQRIALCRALINDPTIILADEPTGNLDPDSAAVVVDALRERARSGSCVIVVTHDETVVASCDRRISL